MISRRFSLGVLFGLGMLAVGIAVAEEKRDPREILDICRSSPELEDDFARQVRFGDAEAFASPNGEWCCYPFYRQSVFIAWVTEYKLNKKNGRMLVRRCIEDARQKANPWTRAGSENEYLEEVIQSTGTAAVQFRKIE